MERDIFIFGHKNPDTDSICSSIAYGELKKKLGYKNAKAVRLGKINRETRFALQHFDYPVPELFTDIKPQVQDLDYYKSPIIQGNDPLKRVWDLMKKEGKPMFPVLHEDGRLGGVISLSDITTAYMEFSDETALQKYHTRFENLVSVLDGKIIEGTYREEEIFGKIYTDSTLKDEEPLSKGDIIITGHNKKLQKLALESGAGCIVLTGDFYEESLCKEAKKRQCVIVQVPYTFFRTIKLINQSIPVSSIMRRRNLVYFEIHDYIEEVKEVMQESKYRQFPVLDLDGKVLGTISRRQLIDFNRKNVILVDHNEKGQSIKGIEQANILEVIDHHRVADIHTISPLYFRAEPVGCTCTIVGKMYQEHGIKPNKKIAGLMLSAILSDTLMFKSPTCTPIDKEMAYKLAEMAEVNIEAYGLQMITAGTSLEGKRPEDIYKTDMKEFTLGKYKVTISQINTTDFQGVFDIKEDLKSIMQQICAQQRVDLTLLMITDILLGGTELLAVGTARELLFKAFDMGREDESIFLPGVLSRKKQVVPKLMQAVEQ